MADLDELLKLLNEEQVVKPKVKERKYKENRDVRSFIRKHSLGPGPTKVPTYVLYYLFVKWHRAAGLIRFSRPCKKEEFFRTFSRHFELKRTGKQRYYLIDDVFNLNTDLYEKAKKYDIKWQKRQKKQKKSEEVSSPDKGHEFTI